MTTCQVYHMFDELMRLGMAEQSVGTQMTEGSRLRGASSARDKAELRAQVQDAVHAHAEMLRARLWEQITREHQDWTQEQVQAKVNELQPEWPEYDPVIGLAMMSVDHRYSPDLRRQAMSEAAQYIRPKLKSVEVTMDPEGIAAREERAALVSRLASLLDAAAVGRRTTVDGEARDITPASPEPIDTQGSEESPAEP